MTDSEIEIDDVEDALRRADELAELTGRDKADVIADLLDDGQLNLSAGSDIEPQKDFLDVAQEKAEKLKTLLITIAPIIALLSGIGLEGAGIVDLTDWGQDSVWDDEGPNEPPYIENDIYGCTAPDAENYNPMANRDDGSCYWDDSPPPPRRGCTDPAADNYNPNAQEDDGTCYYPVEDPELDIQNHELSLVEYNELKVEFNLLVEGNFCCDDIEIEWEIEVDGYYDDNLRRTTYHSYDEEGYIHLEEYWANMAAGDYRARIEVQWQGDMFDEETTGEVTITDPVVLGCTDSEATNFDPEANEDDGSCEYPPETHCDEGDVSMSGFWSTLGEDNATVIVSFTVNIADGPEVDCSQSFFEIEVRLENSGTILAGPTNLSELISESSREFTVVFEDLSPGDHAPGVFVRYQGELVAQNWLWAVNVPEPEPLPCNPFFFDAFVQYQDSTNSSIQVYYDPDEMDCEETVVVEVVFEILWTDNETIYHGAYASHNITGDEWDQLWQYGPVNMSNGNYTVLIELFLVEDGERSADIYDARQVELVIDREEEV